ncbi:MAG: ImmA/IrrE family metallo-endopeptidase [Candidatus Thiodiazotropha endolucinida]
MEKIRAAQVTAKALKTRKTFLGVSPHLAICPYALCEAMGFDLRFVNIPSFEGMYVASQNLVLISAERPEGRKHFTCAHEIGHHVLGHGTIIDEILECGSSNEEELEADFFASMLLMPSSAITRSMIRYGIEANNLTPKDCYILAKYFGVSYQAFITHIYSNLRLFNYRHYQTLKKGNLPGIRFEICGLDTKQQIFSIGDWWEEKALELEVGNYIVTDQPLLVDGPDLLEIEDVQKNILKAKSPGITRVYNGTWSCFVKISRHKFQGFYQYKYDEEEE